MTDKEKEEQKLKYKNLNKGKNKTIYVYYAKAFQILSIISAIKPLLLLLCFYLCLICRISLLKQKFKFFEN